MKDITHEPHSTHRSIIDNYYLYLYSSFFHCWGKMCEKINGREDELGSSLRGFNHSHLALRLWVGGDADISGSGWWSEAENLRQPGCGVKARSHGQGTPLKDTLLGSPAS